MSEEEHLGKVEFARGLEGVIVAETQIGYVDGLKGRLVYRGYDIEDLATHSNYEEVAYLLLHAALPTSDELETFRKKLILYRKIPEQVIDLLRESVPKCHPMAALRSGVSALGCFDLDSESGTMQGCSELCIKLISQVATVTGAIARIRRGLEPVQPDADLDHTANFLYMLTGERPDEFFTKVMDVAMILHADHGMNASAFTSLVIISSKSDVYSAITGAIGSLKGPLHGGANEEVLKMLLDIGDLSRAEAYVDNALARKAKIPGFGHRVYKVYDPRARILELYSKEVTNRKGRGQLYRIAKKLEEQVVSSLGAKGIFPNVDFYSGSVYYSFGIEPAIFTPIFAVSRVAGWVARIFEYLANNRIFRPKAAYTGPLEQKYVPVEQRTRASTLN